MTVASDLTLVAGDEALAQVRAGFTGPNFFRHLDAGAGRLLVQQPVGVGKSVWLAAAARHARQTARPDDLVLIVAPRLDILAETRERLADLKPLVLTGRPRRRCGNLDGPWSRLEHAGCGVLARHALCTECLVRGRCG